MATTIRHRGITFTVYSDDDRDPHEYDYRTARRDLTPELLKVVVAVLQVPYVHGAFFTSQSELIILVRAGYDISQAQGKIMQTIENVTS